MKTFHISYDTVSDFTAVIIANSKQQAQDIFYDNLKDYISKEPNNETTVIYDIVEETI